MITDNLYNISKHISNFILRYLSNKNSFECRSFYGEAFSLALLSKVNILDNETKLKLIKSYKQLDKRDSQFHWEFNNYALLDYINTSKDAEKFLEPLIFKNTPCTNWTLLRSNTRLKANKDIELAINEAKNKILKYQFKSGLILDDIGVKSFQYHCFSMAMIAEIYETTKDKYFKDSFLKGIEFIRHFILSNGETLYIGRGQNQSFGYGALLYILAIAYKYTQDQTILGDIELVLKYLKRFERDDGSYPLVMNGVEETIPQVIDMTNEEFVGWYPYNNYFDYLPFMGFFIYKAYSTLKELDISKIEYKKQIEYKDNDFIKIVKTNYETVLSKTGGYITNDMPMPYIVCKDKSLTPMYGGEEFQKSLYSVKSLPLPYNDFLKKSIRWRSKSLFLNNTLWIFSPLGVMKRKYIFNDNSIQVTTKIFSLFDFKHQYLFLNNSAICNSKESMYSDGIGYSASGKLHKYSNNDFMHKIELEIK